MLVERQFGPPAHLEGHPLLRSEELYKCGEGTCPIAQSIGEYHAEHDPGRMVSLPCILPPPVFEGQQDSQGQDGGSDPSEVSRFPVPCGGRNDHGTALATRPSLRRPYADGDFATIV